MPGYYDNKLAADRLRRAYELAPPRVQQYLESEISHVLEKIRPGETVLELGCGYGRILERLRAKSTHLIGIDMSMSSLKMARGSAALSSGCCLAQMDAATLGLSAGLFNRVLCLQNGISAFHVDPINLVGECIRVTQNGGSVLLSSYAAGFWNDRLEWFRLQAENGLIGEIDWARTGEGQIICHDGFTATTFDSDDFVTLASQFGCPYQIYEVDGSSIFCEITIK